MSDTKIKTGILGLDTNKNILNIIISLDIFAVEAIADKNIELANKFGRQFENCKCYDDFRQMVAQNNFDLLVVLAPLADSIEHVRFAIKKKSNIFIFPPAGRDFSEVSELANLAKSEGVIFSVANYWQLSASWANLKNSIEENKIEHPSFIQIQWFEPEELEYERAWQKDPKLAGGGVVLYNAYQAIDMIVSNFGIPELVYALNINNAPDKQQRAYLTEDSSAILMRFSESLNITLNISRTFGPKSKTIKIYGRNQNLEITENGFSTFDNHQNILEEFEFCDQKDTLIRQCFVNLANKFITPENNSSICQIQENLGIMAVIEAVYLSAKTLMPEEPSKILNLSIT